MLTENRSLQLHIREALSSTPGPGNRNPAQGFVAVLTQSRLIKVKVKLSL
jgi:hypothetical protein